MQNIINIDDLSFGYKRKTLFSGLNLALTAGRIYGLLGRNGSGKTTLLNLISGLLFAHQGKIHTLKENPRDRSAHLLSQIFYLPEQIILPSVSSQQYLSLYSPFYPSFDIEHFDQYSDALEIGVTPKLHTLSHGQQKKFMLAFGLAANCPLNLFDEPTNGLDIPSKSIFRKLVTGAVNDEKCFVISTHQVRDIEHLIDTVIVLDNGKIVFSHPLDEVASVLSVQQGKSNQSGAEIYSMEEGLGRYSVLHENTSGTASTVDLEVLFNAILADSKRIQAVFSN